jgi:hypothetical protein
VPSERCSIEEQSTEYSVYKCVINVTVIIKISSSTNRNSQERADRSTVIHLIMFQLTEDN